MFVPRWSLLAPPPVRRLFLRRSNVSRAEADLKALFTRMRQRLYPETIPALVSFWLKTIYASGYRSRQWKELDRLLKTALDEPLPDDFSQEFVIEIRNWIQETGVLKRQRYNCVPQRLAPVRDRLNSGQCAAYVARFLNEWLPVEVARLLVDDGDFTAIQERGIPVLTVGRAIEHLLVREHLSQETLERLIEPELLSPEYVYPAELEMLRDVALWLLGRTWAPLPSVMPATLLCMAPNERRPADYREALRHAMVVQQRRGKEIHVPLAPARALEMVRNQRVRIGSIIVTMDGCWWEAENLQCGEQPYLVYRPVGRLRIDYSQDHARLRVPWPETRLHWSGGARFRDTFKIFGREWHVSKWETDSERTWLHLEFSRVLPLSEITPEPWRLRPASIDMAWAALESALISWLAEKSIEPIEQLRHFDLIPLGRAIVGFTESVTGQRSQTHDGIQTQLKALRYWESSVVSAYGRVPWRILPAPVRTAFLRVRRYPDLLRLLNEIVAGVPEVLSSDKARRSTSSNHAA